MQVIEDKEKIESIGLEIDKYKHELEEIFYKRDIEEEYKSIIVNLFKQIEKDEHLFIRYKSKNNILESYKQASNMTRKMIYIAAYAEEIGAKEISKEIIKGCSLLIIEIGICYIKFFSSLKKNIKTKKISTILKLIEYQINFLKIDNVKQIKETIKKYGFTDINRYFSAIIDLNENISEIKNKEKKNNKGFGRKSISNTNTEKTNFLCLSIRNLIQTALEIIRNGDEDAIITLQGISWREYENLSETIGEASWCKLSYLDGVLELMSPGLPHEELSENTGEIIKEYCFQKNIKCFAIRSTTLENKKGKKGKQADASYAFHRKSKIPDIAVEINITSGSIEDLKIYADIGVPEVWIYSSKEQKIRFFFLEKDEYKEISNSTKLELINSDTVNRILEIGREGGDINAIRREVIKFLGSYE